MSFGRKRTKKSGLTKVWLIQISGLRERVLRALLMGQGSHFTKRKKKKSGKRGPSLAYLPILWILTQLSILQNCLYRVVKLPLN